MHASGTITYTQLSVRTSRLPRKFCRPFSVGYNFLEQKHLIRNTLYVVLVRIKNKSHVRKPFVYIRFIPPGSSFLEMSKFVLRRCEFLIAKAILPSCPACPCFARPGRLYSRKSCDSRNEALQIRRRAFLWFGKLFVLHRL